MPELIQRGDDDTSLGDDSSWGSMPGLTHRPANDYDSWSECCWDLDTQSESLDSNQEPTNNNNSKTVAEISNIEAIKQVDVSNAYIQIPLGTIPMYEDDLGTHVGSLPILAPDSNDLEEVWGFN